MGEDVADHRWARLARRLFTGAVLALAAAMMTTAAISSQGTDLRPNRNVDLVDLIEEEADRNADLRRDATALRAEVDALTETAAGEEGAGLARARQEAGGDPVQGPAIQVTLSDAPDSVLAEGVDESMLVVHQQDIQAVVNAMWAGGAEAMTIQGQRVTSLTAVKCVGNSVVLHGVPYGPPYVIVAVGDSAGMQAQLESDSWVQAYRGFARRYQLGYEQQLLQRASLPGYEGGGELEYASPLR
ncbi:hypothetical protein CGZ91_11280 [Parenemella sanctibonifatiensis]|uniref:DUF881 domain-containing protein n=1 Tax=Parenemella sanctibonifatiensis TaxID=2016505 RepID=A0A255EMX0_9ACTN|nr:hypothetical protein CGZ91_11280 [Parenemella sanctibonifatiensis]